MCALVWESSHYDTHTFIYSSSSNTYRVILPLEMCTSPLYVMPYTVYLQCPPAKSTVPLLVEALDNAWSGSWRPLTNLTCKFWACHLCIFNVATIFFSGVIPTYGILPYTMIQWSIISAKMGKAWKHSTHEWCQEEFTFQKHAELHQ